MKNFQNILVVRTDRMGDVVLTTPSLRALRRAYPRAKITVLLAASTKDLILGNPHVDEILVDDRDGVNRGLTGFIKLFMLLKKKKFDLAVIYHTKKRTNLACFLAGIPHRVGYRNDKFGFLLSDPIKDERHLGVQHEARYCLNVLEHLGIKGASMELEVSIQNEAQQWLDRWLKENRIKDDENIIAIHPGASDPSRRWPAHRFSELIDEIRSRHVCRIVIIGNMDIRDTTMKIVSSVKTPVIDMTGKTSVSQLAILLKRCSILVSNDSGPVHVASGVGTPVVSIFTRNQPGINPRRWCPLDAKSKVVSTPADTKISFAKAGSVDPQYLELIKTQEVLEAVDAVYKLC